MNVDPAGTAPDLRPPPPSDTDIDAWFASQPDVARWFAAVAISEPGTPARAVVIGWADAAGVQHFEHDPDPAAEPGAAARVLGLRAVHGAVRVRVYSLTWPTGPAIFAAPADEQAAANDLSALAAGGQQ